MANVQFYRGNLNSLPSISDGRIYFVEDERAIYMDHGQNRYRFGCIKVASTAALSQTPAVAGQLAYGEDTNILAYYNGTNWVQINSTNDLAQAIERINQILINGVTDPNTEEYTMGLIEALEQMSQELGGVSEAKDSTTALVSYVDGNGNTHTLYHPIVASTTADGLMSKEDKTALDAATSAISALQGQITGLDGAMHFRGVATVAITDGATANPAITGYDFSNAVAGDVILGSDGKAEYVWTGSAWEEFGSLDANLDLAGLDAHNDARYKGIQTPVTTPPTASGNATTFVTGITQDAQGVITYTTSNVDLSGATMVWTDF